MNTGIWACSILFLKHLQIGQPCWIKCWKKVVVPLFYSICHIESTAGTRSHVWRRTDFIAVQGKIYSSIVHIISRCHFLSIHSQDDDDVWLCWESGWEDKCLGCA